MTTRRNILALLGLSASTVSAADFAQPMGTPHERGQIHFGGDRGRAAAALRALADHLEADGVYVQKLSVHSTAAPEDFVTHTLTIDFAARES